MVKNVDILYIVRYFVLESNLHKAEKGDFFESFSWGLAFLLELG